jgi:hypothetical protein
LDVDSLLASSPILQSSLSPSPPPSPSVSPVIYAKLVLSVVNGVPFAKLVLSEEGLCFSIRLRLGRRLPSDALRSSELARLITEVFLEVDKRFVLDGWIPLDELMAFGPRVSVVESGPPSTWVPLSELYPASDD